MDKIFINQMHFYAYHGMFEEENRLGQKFIVDVELMCSLKEAAATDNVNMTMNYAQVYEIVKTEVEGTRVKLIETLAEHIAKQLLTTFSLHEVRVRVTKPDPPIPGYFQSVGVEVVRRSGDFDD
jgi:dihydroneopterin aldolase